MNRVYNNISVDSKNKCNVALLVVVLVCAGTMRSISEGCTRGTPRTLYPIPSYPVLKKTVSQEPAELSVIAFS